MENGSKNGTYEFDRFRLDADKLMLYRDEAEIAVPPKVVKTLLVLVENSGAILSKEELFDRVWSDSFVEESNLSQHLHRLRRILGNRPDGGPYIETLRRRGYRFNGEVRRSTENANAETIPATPGAPISAVERQGNVLRLVDWKPAPVAEADAVDTVQVTTKREFQGLILSKPLVLAAVVLILIAAAVISILIYRSSVDQPVSASGEITFLRLTNGIKPVDTAISPNGDYFVYHEVGSGTERMWLHQVGQSSRVEIASTAESSFFGAKAFSPDGKFVYFLKSDQGRGTFSLNRVSTIGGPEAKILDDISGPPSFSSDGRQFAFIRKANTGNASALVIADEQGTSQKSILEFRDTPTLVGSPAWSPDGNIIVFAASESDHSIGLYTTDRSGKTPRRVSPERWDNIYRIVWTQDGRGLAMVATRAGESYSTRRNQVYFVSYPDGASRRLTTDGSWHQEWSLGAAKDGAIIAIPFNRSSQIWSMGVDGASASAIQLSHGHTDGRAGLASMPNGKIGFIARVGDEVNLWSMEFDGSALKQLSTSMLPIVEELRADPRGRYFVYSGNKDGHSQLYRSDTDGRNTIQLTFGDDQPVDSTISPDGESVVYHSAISRGVPRSPQLFRIPIHGGKPERFGDSECATPIFSPVDDQLTCIAGDKILLLAGSTGEVLKSYSILPYSNVSTGARWTSDGRHLVYIRNVGGFSNLWIQPLDGGEPRQLTDFTAGDIYNFAFSFDGSRLLVARGQQISDVVLIRNYR